MPNAIPNLPRPLRVHALIDLEWRRSAGGHIKCWERLAEAALRRTDIDLTLHFSCPPDGMAGVTPWANNVRVMLHKPVFSTRQIPFLGHVPDHTDMASFHKNLAGALINADIIHTTDAYFNFARTAEKVAAQKNIPLVHSVHTDTVSYTRLFTRSMLSRMGGLGVWLDRTFKIADGAARGMEKKLRQHQQCAAKILTARPEDACFAQENGFANKIAPYRLGLDIDLFHPNKAAREKLASRLGFGPNTTLIAFAGRLDEGKNIYVLIDALQRAIEEGKANNSDFYLLAAGEGPAQKTIAEKLAGYASCFGYVPPEELAVIYASADWLALPSEVETWSMAAAEALACGLPVMAAKASGVSRFLNHEGAGLLVPDNTMASWARALNVAARLKEDKGLKGHARQAALTRFSGWDIILEQDFLPVWQECAAQAMARRIYSHSY